MALTVVAPLEEKKMEKTVQRLVDKVFSDRTYEFTVQTTDYFTPELQRFDKTVEKHNHEVNAVLGCTAPSLYEEKDRLTAILLSNILGGPASNSLLNSLLREKHGWVYGVESSYTQYADTGILAICFGCDRPNVDKCVRAIGQVLDRLMDKPLSEGRLKAAKKQLLGQLAVSGENGETQCLAMGKSLLAFGRISSFEEDRARIEAVTAEELQHAARSIFAPGKISKLVYL
jgi:predicted Zn-dependent peptidase